MTEQQERLQFEEMMQRHAAALTDILGRYVSRLNKADREWFTERALEIAWDRHGLFDPTKRHLIAWWDDCLKQVARSRPVWRLVTTTGWKEIAGKRLGR